MAQLCSYCGKSPVFGGGYCRYHQYLRRMRGGDLYSPKRRANKPIPKESKRRQAEHKTYTQITNEIWAELVATGKNVCLFCDETMLKKEGFHHTSGRVGDNYLNREHLFPAHNLCHVQKYHRYTLEQLKRESWYEGFLKRLAEVDKEAYLKETNKEFKAELEFEN